MSDYASSAGSREHNGPNRGEAPSEASMVMGFTERQNFSVDLGRDSITTTRTPAQQFDEQQRTDFSRIMANASPLYTRRHTNAGLEHTPIRGLVHGSDGHAGFAGSAAKLDGHESSVRTNRHSGAPGTDRIRSDQIQINL